jgi:hypothetical protein
MAKLSRDDLKGIVKECLLEILSEGLNSSFDTLVESKKVNSRSSRRSISKEQYKRPNSSRNSELAALKQRMQYLDTLKVSQNESADEDQDSRIVANHNFQKNVENTASNLTQDPILSEIFKDTAMTTLQEQLSAETKSPAATAPAATDAYSLKVAQSRPEDLFGGDAASKWATLAFAEK